MIGTGELLLEQHENYIKQTYRNRCKIYSANGIIPLTIPVEKISGAKMAIRDVRIDYSEAWQRVHWKAIEAAYRSSPFYEYYMDDFHPFYEEKETFLFDLNEKILHLSLALIGLKINVRYTDSFVPKYQERDERYTISPKLPLSSDIKFKPQNYYQVFSSRSGFAANLSILDLLCNEGNNSLSILQQSIL
jgi:hypothetical protein